MASSEAMTSSKNYSLILHIHTFPEMFREHLGNFKVSYLPYFQPIFIKLSLFCLKISILSSEIKLTLFRTSHLMLVLTIIMHSSTIIWYLYIHHVWIYKYKLLRWKNRVKFVQLKLQYCPISEIKKKKNLYKL